ncbi:1-phosphofructokinase family hexose kinase [Streptomyces violaceorubidus]
MTEVTERPGGKGLNVARVLAALGHEVTVTGFAGGTTGGVVREGLTGVRGVTDALVPVAGATRRTVAVVDERTGDTTQLNEPGPAVAPAEWNAFQETYEDLLTGAAAVALCGSLPPGVPVGAYAGLVVPRVPRRAGAARHQRGAAAAGARRPPGPDQAERRRAGRADRLARAAACRAGRPARGARSVVASLGAEGLLAVTPEGRWRAAPPAHVRGNPTGAGDSAVAGLLSGLVEHLPWPDRLARAVALSAATVLAPVAASSTGRPTRSCSDAASR